MLIFSILKRSNFIIGNLNLSKVRELVTISIDGVAEFIL
jgi:hypothetical protein